MCSLITTRQEIVPGSPAIFKSISVTSTTEGPAIDTSIEIADPENGFAKSLGVWQVLLQKAASTEKIGVGTFKDTTGVKDFSFKYVYPLSSSYLVPNVANCDGYVNGLSP